MNDSLLSVTTTDDVGKYNFEDNLAGQYYILFTPEEATFINTLSDQGSDDNIDDDVTSFFSMGSTDTIELNFFQEEQFYNAGYYELSAIGDQVFIDINENGINDNESGLDGVIVNLLDEFGSIISTDTTRQGGGLDSGYYLLQNIPPGLYTVQFIRPLFYQFVAADQGGDDTTDSDVTDITDNTGTTKEIEVLSGSSNLSIDAGLFFQVPTESSLSGIVWDDVNNNGIREDSEIAIPNVMIALENQDGEVLDMMLTDSEGIYLFDNLSEGFYSLKATFSLDKIATYPNIGSDDAIDSDFLEKHLMGLPLKRFSWPLLKIFHP